MGQLPSPPESIANLPTREAEEETHANAQTNDGDAVQEVDLKTPDKHVPRDPRLIRLTGIHPFNAEAPLSDLFNEGFLTSKELHFVRSHGYVPQVEDAEIMDWEFIVEGLVDRPLRLSLAQLIADFEQVTYPVTIVCAGNRRKEQNVVRKTKGFSWGAAGLSTALWTGVALSDLLNAAKPHRRARYVCFEGADKLPNGYYGTSVKKSWAMDPNRGILVAHRMNGEALTPDHGKPVRIIVPGQIGGRSVKWLRKIILTEGPSDNWYHIYDNRVLPTMIDPEQSANLPGTWTDERYAIYDLNTNSVICYPAHDETVVLGNEGTHHIGGYAYAGGGKRVTRVEVTFDQGKTWKLANITYHEDQYREAPNDDRLYGGRLDVSSRDNCFCWCFWDLGVSNISLQSARDIMVRAMDDSMMIQPRDMYWSVLGMMNNPWFRVVVQKDGNKLKFEHPTQPALIPGGWMARVKEAGGDISNGLWGEMLPSDEELRVVKELPKDVSLVDKDVHRSVTVDELREHGGEKQPWFVVQGHVYDGTEYLAEHPGGAASIFSAAGQDATEDFLAIHSENAKAMLHKYHIGTLDEASREALTKTQDGEGSVPQASFLRGRTWSRAILTAKTQVSPDTKVFTFDLEHKDQTSGLCVGQHAMLRLRDPVTREAIIRLYTPISEVSMKGSMQVLVKVYRDSPQRKGGRMSQALDGIPIGHFVDFKGPLGKFEYIGRGVCSVQGSWRNVKRFVMVCAGTGLTPMMQILLAILGDAEDSTYCLLIDANRTEEDILCRAELDRLVTANASRCRVAYALSQPSASWTGLKGRLDRSFLETEVGRDGDYQHDLVLICGPEAFVGDIRNAFHSLGWGDDSILSF
ncbi:hypothetical protein ONZ45_g167 [Pleurotus djamor]|nr:hypothetical protein ONZ45_g167 [Pleurotus djamor]